VRISSTATIGSARAAVELGFRAALEPILVRAGGRKAKQAHPDAGGTAEMFRMLVEARDRLLTALGTSAPPPKPPQYAPPGAIIRYRRVSSGTSRRLGSTTRRLE